ncbi:MAG: diacylglycerol kinase family protein [Bacilli bacterium]|nr:diacylglycerol kinase family protein [Bacilli bacterium]
MNYLYYNPLANNGKCEQTKDETLTKLEAKYGKFEVASCIGVDASVLEKFTAEDMVVLLGGDGTLNKFANMVYGKELPCKIYLHKSGTGNDFMNDVADKVFDDMVELNEYVKRLPKVIINGTETRYLNGIGYGIDGMACVVADEMKRQGKTEINYAKIVIGLLFKGYTRPNAKVTVDGVTKEYKKVYLASGMNGRYYGGGMAITPNQDRNSDLVSSCVVYNASKLKVLCVFPSIFKGKHVKHTKMVDIRQGKDILVEFDQPMGLQIDGEVVENVTSYRVVKD